MFQKIILAMASHQQNRPKTMRTAGRGVKIKESTEKSAQYRRILPTDLFAVDERPRAESCGLRRHGQSTNSNGLACWVFISACNCLT